eukprot:PhM_4_TR13199/c0_g1_i1/m.24856
MGGLEQIALPFVVLWLVIQIPPTMMELYCYYVRGGLVALDFTKEDGWQANYMANTDWYVYLKRFCDRPTSKAAKAYYGYLDWSSAAWDKSVYIARRNLAKHYGEVPAWWPYVYGPFIFNWRAAHNKQWVRGDDAAGMKMPMWGDGGEARARHEYLEAKEKGYDLSWRYEKKHMRRLAKEHAEKEAAAQAAAAAADEKRV